ncbi:MAG: hypothetical protein AAF802_21090 [Planctomycetota bacterium]
MGFSLNRTHPTAILASIFLVIATSSVRADDEDAREPYTDSERFDLEVREDIFAGLNGDEEALKRGVQKCDQALAKNPDHAEALVWRGAAKVFQSGQAFGGGDRTKGMKLWMEGLHEMNQAKKLEPDNLGVMIPRAAVMINAGRNAPDFMGRPVLESVREDFEATYESQKETFNELGEHPQGELRMGLADVYRLLGETEKSKAQLDAIVKEMPGTEYAQRAAEWLKAKPTQKLAHNCIGCHGD